MLGDYHWIYGGRPHGPRVEELMPEQRKTKLEQMTERMTPETRACYDSAQVLTVEQFGLLLRALMEWATDQMPYTYD